MKKKLALIIFIFSSFMFFAEDRNVKPGFIFSGSQNFSGMVDSGRVHFLNLEHDLFISLEIPVSFYTFSIWSEDSLLLDFAYMQEKDTLLKMIDNSLSSGIDNTFFFKNIIYANVNFNVNYVLPFNQYKADSYVPSGDKPYLTLAPVLKTGGMYYFGLDWEIEEDLPVKLIFNTDASSFKPSTKLSLNFEFFRFYGPKNFTFSINSSDSFTFSVPLHNFRSGSEEQPVTFLNNLNIGLAFNFFDVSITLGLLHNITYDVAGKSSNSRETGFTSGVSYTFKLFTFSAGYTGYIEYVDTASKWISNFNAGWSISISRNDLSKKK